MGVNITVNMRLNIHVHAGQRFLHRRGSEHHLRYRPKNESLIERYLFLLLPFPSLLLRAMKDDDEPLRPADQHVQPALGSASQYEKPLLHFFALHRYATPYNVMETLPQYFKTHKYVMRHLNWMHNRGYLTRHGTERTGYTFVITNIAYERCRDDDIAVDLHHMPYKYTEPKGKHIAHDLLITKCAVSLYRCVQREPGIRILAQGRYVLDNIVVADPETGEELRPFEHMKPDYFYLSKDRNGMMMFRMLEVVYGVESIDNFRGLVEKHEEWGNSRAAQVYLTELYREHGAQNPTPEYQTHCMFETDSWKHTDEWKERTTMMQSFHVSPMMQLRLWTSTKNRLDKAVSEGLTINHNIWHRGKDLVENRERWLRAEKGSRTRLVDGWMRSLRTYPLFA